MNNINLQKIKPPVNLENIIFATREANDQYFICQCEYCQNKKMQKVFMYKDADFKCNTCGGDMTIVGYMDGKPYVKKDSEEIKAYAALLKNCEINKEAIANLGIEKLTDNFSFRTCARLLSLAESKKDFGSDNPLKTFSIGDLTKMHQLNLIKLNKEFELDKDTADKLVIDNSDIVDFIK